MGPRAKNLVTTLHSPFNIISQLLSFPISVQTMSAITRSSLWSASRPRPPNAPNLNTEAIKLTPAQRLALLDGRSVSGLATFSPTFEIINLFCASGLYSSDGTTLTAVIGSSFDSTSEVVPLKLDPGVLGLCLNVVAKDKRAQNAVGGPKPLEPDHLIGTKWEGQADLFFESCPLAYIYPMSVPPQYGSYLDQDWPSKFPPNTTPDAQAWKEHVEHSMVNSADVSKILAKVKDHKKEFISAHYDAALWNPTGPCIDALSFSRDEMATALERLKADMKVCTTPAIQLPSQAPSGATSTAPKPKELIPGLIKNMAMQVRALVDWTTGDIPGALLAPHFNNSFDDAMEKSTITERGEHMRLNWKSTLNPRQQDPLATLSQDPDAQHIS